MTPFNEYWLETGAAVPVDIETTAILLREIQRLRSKEQKPVAWIKNDELAYMSAAERIGEVQWKTNLGLKPEPGDVPLYVAPREWIGLTDEDIADLHTEWAKGNLWDGWNYERAIESKLKEKNHG
jgi:hypothetical protein